jgi:hypothetical protein
MNRTISKPAASLRLDQQVANGATGAGEFCWRPHVAASRRLFAAPPVDLTTLVIAQEIRRKEQAERQREVLRDSAYAYEMPVRQERNRTQDPERDARIHPADFDA